MGYGARHVFICFGNRGVVVRQESALSCGKYILVKEGKGEII